MQLVLRHDIIVVSIQNPFWLLYLVWGGQINHCKRGGGVEYIVEGVYYRLSLYEI
jgi:hypothetical protein